MRLDHARDLLRRVSVICLVITAACSLAGWAHTARALNALVDYKPVGREALRLAEAPSPSAADRIRLTRERAGRDTGRSVSKPLLIRAGSRAPG